MSTTTPTETPHEAAVKAFADAVLSFLKSEERPFEWLARQTGVPSTTLRAQLKEKPARLTHINALRIAQVVPVPLFEEAA